MGPREKGESTDPSPTCSTGQSMNTVLYTNIYSFHIFLFIILYTHFCLNE